MGECARTNVIQSKFKNIIVHEAPNIHSMGLSVKDKIHPIKQTLQTGINYKILTMFLNTEFQPAL